MAPTDQIDIVGIPARVGPAKARIVSARCGDRPRTLELVGRPVRQGRLRWSDMYLQLNGQVLEGEAPVADMPSDVARLGRTS